MIAILLLVPVLATITALLMYQFNGKKEIIKLDIVQFLYSFVLAPILFVWSKTLLYVLLRSEPGLELTSPQLFVIDTLFSLLFIFIFAFIVMHSVTKSINLKVFHDPLHDIFKHSEYFHLWISHLVIFIGTGFIFTVLSVVNIFFPLDLSFDRSVLFLLVTVGSFFGLIGFLSIWLSDPKQHSAHFLRLIKLSAGLFFLIHSSAYFLLDVTFTAKYSLFWFNSSAFAALVISLFFVNRSERALTVTEKIAHWFKHRGWDTRVQLFLQKK